MSPNEHCLNQAWPHKWVVYCVCCSMVACVWLLLMGSFRVVRETLTMQLIGVAETGAAAGFAMRALDLWRVHSAALFVCDT